MDFLTIGGSIIAPTIQNQNLIPFNFNGGISARDDIGTATIKGSLIGNRFNPVLITAFGQANPTATVDLAIGKLTVNGRVEYAQIWAGLDAVTQGGSIVENADAQIGQVVVGGDWIASSLTAGAFQGPDGLFGTADDVKFDGIGVGGVKDVDTIFSKITSLTIGGQAYGTVGGDDHYGIVAEIVGSVKVKGGTTTFSLNAGNGNDDFFIGILGDFKVHEI